MKVAIDTNSLLSLVRYYFPFDKESKLFDFIKSKIEIGEIVIIDKILEECQYTSKGIVLDSLTYLTDKSFLKSYKIPLNTEFILPLAPAKFLRQVDNQFVNGVIKNKLSPVEYENRKNNFMNSADMKLVLFCLNKKNDNPMEDIYLVTEETEDSNDSKVFKKIPTICKALEIDTITLPQLLNKFEKINLEFK
ncbi:MAG: DUF4411 family protein [Chitinophagaceae bacterium]